MRNIYSNTFSSSISTTLYITALDKKIRELDRKGKKKIGCLEGNRQVWSSKRFCFCQDVLTMYFCCCVEQSWLNFLGYELIDVKSSAINSLLSDCHLNMERSLLWVLSFVTKCPISRVFQLISNQFLPTGYKPKMQGWEQIIFKRT